MRHLHSRATISAAVLGMCLVAFCGCEKKTPAPPKVSKDFTIDLGSSVTLEMVWIPGGTFLMGSPYRERSRLEGINAPNEGPQTQVQVDGFWMGKYEVTQEQYQEVIGTNPSLFKGSKNPVEKVFWADTMAFCKKLSERTGKHFTLPTEAQWEYACRAGSQTSFCFGDSDGSLGDYAWYISNYRGTTHPVGEKKSNAFGLYDMHGNVREFCLSLCKPYPYNDEDGRNDPTTGDGRVIRGGCWGTGPNLCRSRARDWRSPSYTDCDIGFRVVCIPR